MNGDKQELGVTPVGVGATLLLAGLLLVWSFVVLRGK